MADIYNAEKQLLRALPKMVKAANSDQLRAAFEQHLEETMDQVRRVEQAFEALGELPRSKKCEAMEGLIEEGEHMLDLTGPAQDAGLIAAAQKIEHYEIASYGTICTWAQLLGENSALRFLKQTMSEEEAADKRLTDIAMQINDEANTGHGERENKDRRGLLSRVFPS
jgi:ferritin-like metal-binding protein YciE